MNITSCVMKIISNDVIHDIHVNGIDIINNTIYLVGEDTYISGTGVDETEESGVEFLMANRFIKNLNILSSRSDNPITIHMKSCGGHWQEGMAIYDSIKACKNTISVINYTHARSMTSLIYLASDKRIMMPHSTYMIHEGTIVAGGTHRQFKTEAEQNEKSMKQMMIIYVDHLFGRPYWEGKTKKQIHNWLVKQMREKEEVYFSSEEAVEMGFADEIRYGYE